MRIIFNTGYVKYNNFLDNILKHEIFVQVFYVKNYDKLNTISEKSKTCLEEKRD